MRHGSRPTPTVVTVGRRRAVAAVAVLLAVLGGALVSTAVAAQQDTTNTDTADVRIVARKLESGRIEFGLQQRQADDSWGDRRLPRVRFFPATARVGRWLASSPIDLPGGKVRIVARRLESGRVEFGLQQRQADDSWGDRRLPRVRFFPATARVGRWLASSPVTVRGFSIADEGSGPVAGGQPQQASGSYRDVRADAPYAEAVAALAGAGVFAGTWCNDGFCPDDPIDRKTMAVWLVRLLDGADPSRASESRFRDVDAAGFHAPFIERLADLDRVTGCRAAARLGPGRGSFAQFRSFGPDEDVTRAQAVAFIAGFYCFAWAVPEPDFSDVPPGVWYADVYRGANLAHAVAWGHFEGCDGGNRFCPDRTMTRAEMAAALWRAEYPEHPQVPPAEQPQQVSVTLTGAMDGGGVISGGLDQTCALRYDQTVVCWGLHYDFKVSYPPFRFQSVSAGAGAHSCGVRVDQTLACWGGADQYGYVDAPPSGRFTSVSAGGVHSCGLRIEGTIECWWIGEHFGDVFNSGQADAPSGSFTAVSAGSSHTCGVRADQRVICWGENRHGQADAPSGSFTAVSTGQSHTCGLRSDGTVACWGDNDERQADAPPGRFIAVSAGRRHSCGIRIDQTIACWGSDRSVADVRSAGRFIAVSAGVDVPCAIRVGGTVECWGPVPGGRRDPSTAVWGVPPVSPGCAPQPVSGGRPGRPADTQVAPTGAVDAQGLLIPPAFVRWGDPCEGGRVDHYVVQWRRGYEDFAADRQRIVDATDSPTTYEFRLRDRWVYAVRVTAVNNNGRTSSDEVIVPTPANEVRAIVETFVSRYGDRVPWLADTWTYMKHRRSPIYATYCGDETDFDRYAVSCVHYPQMLLSYPYTGSSIYWILPHEMAHIYHGSVFGYTSALSGPDGSPPAFGDPERQKDNAAALGAALLYLLTSFPECNATEMLADMAAFVMPLDEDGPYTGGIAVYWQRCSFLATGLATGSAFPWQFMESELVRDVARSVFVDQEIPRWFFDTYQRADGTWHLDAIRSALSDADQQLDTSDQTGIRAALRTFIPDL